MTAPLPQWDVTVEYIPHLFFAISESHTVEDISALDEEAAEEFAKAEVRALEGVTVREFVKATAVRVDNVEKAKAALASLSKGFPPRSAET